MTNLCCLDLGRIPDDDDLADDGTHAHDEHDGVHDDIDDNWFSQTDYQHMQRLGNLTWNLSYKQKSF